MVIASPERQTTVESQPADYFLPRMEISGFLATETSGKPAPIVLQRLSCREVSLRSGSAGMPGEIVVLEFRKPGRRITLKTLARIAHAESDPTAGEHLITCTFLRELTASELLRLI